MAQVTCSRCFRVFEARDVRPGLPPVCPACIAEAPALTPRPMPAVILPRDRAAPPAGPRPAPARAAPAPPTPPPRTTPAPRSAPPRPPGRRRRRPPWRGVAALAGALAIGGAAVGLLRRPAASTAAPAPTPAERLAASWREEGVVRGPPAGANRRAAADARVADGRAALAADRPDRTAAALAAFQEALAADPARLDAAAGWAIAFAEAAGDAPDGMTLQAAHDVVRSGLERERSHPALSAAYARLLLLVPSRENAAEALATAERAAAAAPSDPEALVARALAGLDRDPAAAARDLERAWSAAPRDRRLLSVAARARWRAGDAPAAADLAARRIALDPDHVGALALLAEIDAASGRPRRARAHLERWAAVAPADARPLVELAKLAYQVDRDARAARRLLARAGALAGAEPFLLARTLAHLAAVERGAGEDRAASAAVAEALAAVPGSGPARFQAALLASARGDGPGLRESAGVLGARAGPVAAQRLAARSAELSGTADEAIEAYRALGDLAPRDPAVLLEAGAGCARLGASGPAVALAERALRRDPLEARLRRAPTEYWDGGATLADAAGRYEAIARAEPNAAATAYAAAAVAQLLLDRVSAAEALARSAAEAAPQRALPGALLAEAALEAGQPRRALDLARAAAEADPADAVVLEVRARALEAVGKRLEAQRAHREALEAAPDLATARLALARLLARDRQPDAARAAAEALLRDDPEVGEARGLVLDLAPRSAAVAARR